MIIKNKKPKILCISFFYHKLSRIQKCYNSASNDLMEHPDETAEKKSSLHNIQED